MLVSGLDLVMVFLRQMEGRIRRASDIIMTRKPAWGGWAHPNHDISKELDRWGMIARPVLGVA
jgi:hypothetical protein